MILILSEHLDVSTDKVCDWLSYYKADFIRTNDETNNYNIFGNINFEKDKLNFELKLNDKTYNLNEITCIWCRRGHLNVKFPNIQDLNFQEPEIVETISKHLANETNTLKCFFEYLINEKMHINNPNQYNSNKLIALRTAQKAGLKIPETLVTQNANDLKKIFNKHHSVITKNIQDVLTFSNENYHFGHSTQDVEIKDIKTKTFFYSLFQKKIERKYELRIFFLLGKFFAHATLSPQNQATTDIRGTSGRNKITAFNLPEKIKVKLISFMKKMNLESGSIDMIVDKNDDYYFLEVNPVGQFGYVSGYNNYYIEREIAKTLINFKNEQKFNKQQR
ncbi:MAG: grasp-with-spasm system ATP-grasp peptide maturase [Bacteroidales bacterium]|jgi:ATP-GRASP peptide maturase of grasp-with-spasm system|nr:grasp-with-spasm system ATP-grasp peptide maturase [Bacteroidales bacterium]